MNSFSNLGMTTCSFSAGFTHIHNENHGHAFESRMTMSDVSITSRPGQLSDKLINNLKKLEAIASLENNWNGNGAPALDMELINNIRSIVFLMPIQPEIFPTACGSIQLEFNSFSGGYMEIEIDENYTAELFEISAEGSESARSFDFRNESIINEVNKFYGK